MSKRLRVKASLCKRVCLCVEALCVKAFVSRSVCVYKRLCVKGFVCKCVCV